MRLAKMYNLQKELDEMIMKNHEKAKNTTTNDTILDIVEEICELRRAAGGKSWTKEKPIDRNRVLDEFADIMHFVLKLARELEISPEGIYQAYLSKNLENRARQQGKIEGRENYAKED